MKQDAANRLVLVGVSLEDAQRLLQVTDTDRRLIMVVLQLPGEPREGDRVTVRFPHGHRALRVEAFAPARGTQWAIVGSEVPPAGSPDLIITP